MLPAAYFFGATVTTENDGTESLQDSTDPHQTALQRRVWPGSVMFVTFVISSAFFWHFTKKAYINIQNLNYYNN